MSLSKNFTFQTITAAVLAVGLSMPLYASETTDSVTPMGGAPAPNVVSQTTKVVTTTTTRAAKHRAHHPRTTSGAPQSTSGAPQSSSGAPQARSGNYDEYGGVVWKDGTIYHDVEPTAQSQSSEFGTPTTTSDTLKGGITSTISTVPAQ